MTDIEKAGTGTVAVPDDDLTGLEDFDTATDAQMPMLKIDHSQGHFIDGLSDEDLGPEIKVIMLGLIKQRILWDAEVKDDAKPLCKSYNFTEGRPDEATFPVKASGFDRSAVESGALPCADCKLKDWGSHPKNDTPWCTEQHTFALLVQVGDGWQPALLTVQRSAIKPSRQYMTSFARSKTPLYTVVTTIKLDQRKRGSVDYAVPKFTRGGGTDQDDWAEYAETYRSIRNFVQTPRTRDDDDEDTTVTITADADPAPSGDGEAPAAAPSDDGDDDLPF
jgi:hypothetical protein